MIRAKGKIKSWNDKKGYGFIAPFQGEKQLFVHISAFENRDRRPKIGEVVTYTLSTDKQGRPCATKATFAGDRHKEKPKRKTGLWAFVVPLGFLIVVSISVIFANTPPVVVAVYLATSVVTFILYAVDKSAARRDPSRISEKTLHVLSLAGGWPGAILAQQSLRHKSSKKSFRSVFWITVVLNCVAFVWLSTPTGASAFNSFISNL